MGDYEAVVNNMTASGYRYPEDPSLRIKANIILASALYCLARYKQAEGVCAEAMRFQRQSVDAKSLRMQMGDIQALVDKIREKQNEEIRLLQKGDPYKVGKEVFALSCFGDADDERYIDTRIIFNCNEIGDKESIQSSIT